MASCGTSPHLCADSDDYLPSEPISRSRTNQGVFQIGMRRRWVGKPGGGGEAAAAPSGGSCGFVLVSSEHFEPLADQFDKRLGLLDEREVATVLQYMERGLRNPLSQPIGAANRWGDDVVPAGHD